MNLRSLIALAVVGCATAPPVPSPLPATRIARADTVRVGRVHCVFLTLRDGTHALGAEQPKQCDHAFLRWVSAQP